MARQQHLTEKKLALIDDLFETGFDEKAVLKKHNVSSICYRRWLVDEQFVEAMDNRIEWLNRQSRAIIAQYATLAATKLVELTDSEKDETARKACLDIISLPKQTTGAVEAQEKTEDQSEQLSDSTASKLLAVLAREKKKGK